MDPENRSVAEGGSAENDPRGRKKAGGRTGEGTRPSGKGKMHKARIKKALERGGGVVPEKRGGAWRENQNDSVSVTQRVPAPPYEGKGDSKPED